MPNSETDTRSVTLVDIPLVARLSEKGTILDSELGLTRETPGLNTTWLSGLILPQRGLHTLVARSDKQSVVGQFRLRADDHSAHIVYIAPHLEQDAEDTVWLHILDAMAREAGKHNAHNLIAEVEENSNLFETLRSANFSVYARQEIWKREPGDYPPPDSPVMLTEETESDAIGIYSLLCTTVPGLLQQIAAPPDDLQGLVYRKEERVEGYFAISEGKQGVYIIPYLHTDIMSEAAVVLETAISQISRASKVPVYVCMRRYQDWLTTALRQLDFSPWVSQAVMVRHITAGVRHANFEPLRRVIEVPTNPIPPSKHVGRPYAEVSDQE